MTDRPILFSAPMIRALLDGREVQTRRLAWGKPMLGLYESCGGPLVPICKPTIWQSVKPGDRLWVRETWREDVVERPPFDVSGNPTCEGVICYAADDHETGFRWRPSIHMPRWASRLTLLVTATKRQRVQEISEEDAKAEGVDEPCGPYYPNGVPADIVDGGYRARFAWLWDNIHKPGARWEDNPEVVALTFSVVKANIDALAAT